MSEILETGRRYPRLDIAYAVECSSWGKGRIGFYIKRLSLINADGKEQLLLRNPADYKGGFWCTYLKDGIVHKVSSTESDSLRIVSEEPESGRLHIVLDHIPDENSGPTLRLDIEIWSYN